MSRKLRSYQYKSPSEFSDDLFLIYTNCRTYNCDPVRIFRRLSHRNFSLMHTSFRIVFIDYMQMPWNARQDSCWRAIQTSLDLRMASSLSTRP